MQVGGGTVVRGANYIAGPGPDTRVFIAWTLRDWCTTAGTNTSYIEPGSPWENPFVESYNARMRDELLALTEFCPGGSEGPDR